VRLKQVGEALDAASKANQKVVWEVAGETRPKTGINLSRNQSQLAAAVKGRPIRAWRRAF
jgi:hypothetical protein